MRGGWNMPEDLEASLSDFEKVIAERLPYYTSANPIARTIREIYATKAAYAVLSAVRSVFGDMEAVHPPASPDLRPVLPTVQAAQAAAPDLIDAVNSRDQNQAVRALERLGVLALCPSHNTDFGRLEYSAGSIVGRVRLIPLVELANLAAEMQFFENASRYVDEAHRLSPGPAQLHHLHTVAGLVALSRGDLALAVECLTASVQVCRKNDWASSECGVREHNLTLADQLLDYGQHAAVASYLVKCQGVWKHNAKRMRDWVEEINAGKRPDLPARPIFMGDLAAKMKMQITWGDFFAETAAEDLQIGTFEEFRKRHDDEVRRAIKGKLYSSGS
jgi:hypothetical protein